MAKYVVTEYGCDWGYNFCSGIYDDAQSAYGKVLESIIDSMHNNWDKEVKIRIEEDQSNGDYVDVICTKPANESHVELEEGYRVYYMRKNST